ncbi:MAG: hypothetical protein LBT24_06495 [Tannerella sp.]|nr:hypothetical protein [Tannerella sp.]
MKLQLFIVILLCSGYGLKAQDASTKTNLFEYGTPVVSCEDNFSNFFQNFSKYVVNADMITFLGYRYVDVVKSNNQAKRYLKKNYDRSIPKWGTAISYQSNGGVNKLSIKLEHEPGASFAKSQIKDLVNTVSNEFIHTGDKIYALKFVFEGKTHEYFIFIEPQTKKVVTFGNVFGFGIQEAHLESIAVSESPKVDEKISLFEKNYAATLSSDKKEIKLIGFITIPIEPENREKFKNLAKNDEFNKNTYFADDYSFCRTYYMFHTAIIDYNGVQYTANEKGIVSIPGSVDIGKIKIIGRKRSETVRGTGTNIIEGEKILFKEGLKQDGISGYSYPKDGICVFATTKGPM